MEHVTLGRTGLRVSRACLGTMTFGLQCDEPTSTAILDAAAEAGITFLDTADVYPHGSDFELMGRTEEIVGRWLEGRRDQFVLATKCGFPMGPLPWQQGGSRRHVLESIDKSLRRLRTDYVDVYLLHRWDPVTPLDEIVEAFDAVVRSGKARYVGISNLLAYNLARARGRAEAKGLTPFTSVQLRYNLLFREFERELLPLCAEEGVGVTVFNPIAGGLLSGKHDRTKAPVEGRFTINKGQYKGRYWHDREFDLVDAFAPVAREAGMPLAELAIAWVAAHPAVSSVILGASRPEHLVTNVRALAKPLDAVLKARLDEMSIASR